MDTLLASRASSALKTKEIVSKIIEKKKCTLRGQLKLLPLFSSPFLRSCGVVGVSVLWWLCGY